MASIQSKVVSFWLRRQKPFSGYDIDPELIRVQTNRVGGIVKPHRKVRIVPAVAGSVPGEWLIPPGASLDRAVLYIHGGAWFMGSTDTHRAFVSRLVYASHVRAISINYRLAPEHPFPAGLEDCITAYDWLQTQGVATNKIIVAGDSAGGNLAMALLIALKDAGKPLPAGAVALSPATDLAFTGESIQSRLHLDPILSHSGTNTIIQDYLGNHDAHEPLISPLYANLDGLPPLLIHVGDHEILLDDAVRFGKRAVAAGVEAQTVVWPEMFHVFQLFIPFLPEARLAVKQIAEFIRQKLEINNVNEG